MTPRRGQARVVRLVEGVRGRVDMHMELALRFEVIDGLVDGFADHGEVAPTALPTLVSQARDGERMVQMHSRVVGRRIYRVVAIFPPALEGDATILRFMQSVRYHDGPN